MKTTFKKSETNFGCYEKTKVDALLSNEDFTIEDVLNADVSFKDKAWFVTNNCDLTDKQEHQLAVNIGYVVLPIFEEKYPHDYRVRRCLEAAQAYIDGEITFENLMIARCASSAAAANAADAAFAYSVSYDACVAASVSYSAYTFYFAAIPAYTAAKQSNNPDHYNSELNKTLKNFFNI